MRLPSLHRACALLALTGVVVVATTPAAGTPAAPGTAAGRAGAGWLLVSHDPAEAAPTFVGNGYVAARVPAAGAGFAAAPVPTDSQVAGFYAQTPGYAQQRADIPTWSTLALDDGSGRFGSLPGKSSSGQWDGRVAGYRQALDLRRGVLATDAVWTSPGGRSVRLHYSVFVDQAQPHVAVVQLRFTPSWNGQVTVTDALDGRDTQLRAPGGSPGDMATSVIGGELEGTDTQLSTPGAAGRDAGQRQIYESVTALGTRAVAAEASTLRLDRQASVSLDPAVAAAPESIGQRAVLPVRAGHAYVVTKYVGIDTSHEHGDPLAAAQAESLQAARLGARRLLAEHAAAWARLWRSDIEIRGDLRLQRVVRASLFYLLESIRSDSAWSLSPAGLSSAGYNGHVFWDAETWMYPALLALHPDIAAAVDRYRVRRLSAAVSYARASGYAGARFPWESAVSGDEQTPTFANTPVVVPPFPDTGKFEQHITADVALALWQYFLASGSTSWLRHAGWPVIQAAARFWASRAVFGPHGRYHIDHVMGPDEYRADVNDSAYTNVAAATTLRIAMRAARLVGSRAPQQWRRVAHGLVAAVPFDRAAGVHREDAAYRGETVKQGDVVMLQYPWRMPMPRSVAFRDIDYYAARTDVAGPSMTDAVNAIDLARLGARGCADDFYLRRSVDPFVRAPFDQFAETRTGGAFTFLTGAGGFLQAFVYGFAGLQWATDAVVLRPSLPPQVNGITLRGLAWHGRRFTVQIGTHSTAVTVTGGRSLPVRIGSRRVTVGAGHPVVVPTRTTAADRSDVALCRPVTATSADPSYPAVGAVDGDPATAWHATSQVASLRIDLGQDRRAHHVQIRWGASRATRYSIVHRAGSRYVTIRIRATNTGGGAVIDELRVE